jgi:hypothetical protein
LKRKYWPETTGSYIRENGFTNEELEKLVTTEYGFLESQPYPTPIIFWPMELYSFGKCYRSWLGWPRFIPLCMYGDHGVHLKRELEDHEIQSPSRFHLTWSDWRLTANRNVKKIVQIQHPWVTYRLNNEIFRKPDSQGTLVYLSHSLPNKDFKNYDFEEYFKTLSDLPAEYKPIVISMPMHDINKGLHKEIRKYGFPLVTAGNTSSPFFVDRFYAIASNFRFATSNSPGSQLFYCHELGLEYFLLGREPVVASGEGSTIASNDPDLADLAEKLFHFNSRANQAERDSFVKAALGLGANFKGKRATVVEALIGELFRMLPYVFSVITRAGTTLALQIIKRSFSRIEGVQRRSQ